MSDEFTHVIVEFLCSHCRGAGRVPGGESSYVEFVSCGLCQGRGQVKGSVTIDDFVKVIAARLEKRNGTEPSA